LRDAARAKGGEKELLTQVATSDQIWLTPAEVSRLHNYADVSGKKQQQYLSIFQSVISG
jgi:hypothetical protein